MIKGICPALLTQFHDDLEINYEAMEKHIEFLISKGIHGLFPVGTTGEGLLLSLEERKEVCEHVIKVVNGRIPVLVHIGEQTTEDTIELAQHAEKAGAYGVATITPYFIPVDDEAVYEHYSSVSNSISPDFPLFVYNNPNNAGNEISLDILYRLIEDYSNITGLKYSPDNFKQIIQIINNIPEDFSVMLGPEEYFYAGLCVGSSGNISAIANIYPELFVNAYESFNNGDLNNAKKMQAIINDVSVLLGSSISALKKVLIHRGFSDSKVRTPLRNITSEETKELYKNLDKISELKDIIK